MSATGDAGDDRSGGLRRFVAIALGCLALLVLPIVGLLLFPAPRAAPRPVTARASATAIATAPLPAATAPSRPASAPRPPSAPRAEPEPGAISGVVLDPDGHPQADAFVECTGGTTRPDEKWTSRSDAEGRFLLPAEALGCRGEAHLPTAEPADSVVLVAGSGNVLRLARPGGIAGVVVDEAGAPVTSYWLDVESFVAKDGQSGVSAGGRMRRFDAPDGSFALEGLYSGRYVLSAAAEGMPPAKSEGVEVERGRTTSHVRIVLARGATLTGVVTDAETRRPIAGATLALDVFSGVASAASRGAAPVTTDASGAFSLGGVPRGPFSVRIEANGYRQKIAAGLDARGGKTMRQDFALTPQGDGGGSTELMGIGAMLAPSPKGVTILGLVPNGPAEKGGLAKGDRIARIDGEAAGDLPVGDVIQRLRGPEGTRVRVAVVREGGGSVEVTLTRENIVR